ncbi:hypothetical protein SPRG_11331 [Saprolegnia parasitica CBS 223.65]|uniref:FAD/NAD(P)-binding domain-containing protein n=1 Tax=Saprolegnia parasitica (strain CBS 223.65) TaxID=695850 RepID=A0A067BV23_SAPPC|nr:hypothetical protein SPRG_11331 [Saprolegnia parasitica CBS 223.65]KDO22379.1 hypothetical protein SPRG_11331 [Saprolegnia parasitica CBS 223.65]|eukprot:XP_012206903.1 hypothetical protein SPRG_11331 [Saprolegnia parasitica CBS 223.65]
MGKRVAIIGTGVSGLGLAIQLQRSSRQDEVVLFEKASDLGGTWRDNTYPGAECDVEAELYAFSFEPNPSWSATYPTQAEILAYLEHCATKYDVRRLIRFNTTIDCVVYDASSCTYLVTTTAGDSDTFDVVVSAVGLLHRAFIPEIPGASTFAGTAFHSAAWDHSVDLRGKRIALIGAAASAIQIGPALAPIASQLLLFQRSAHWVLPKSVRRFSLTERWLARRWSIYQRARRWVWHLLRERIVYLVLWRHYVGWLRAIFAGGSQLYMWWHVREPRTRALLTPSYPFGGKRILVSDDYYPMFQRPNVSIVSEPIARITANELITTDGAAHNVDVIVFATGFTPTSFLVPMDVRGVGGQRLHDAWDGCPHAYLGMQVHGFPNFFMLYGPNTNSAHSSILLLSEAQAHYVVQCLHALDAQDARVMDVRSEASAQYQCEMARRCNDMIWADVDASPYKDATSGKITTMWPGTMHEYVTRTRSVDVAAYIFE